MARGRAPTQVGPSLLLARRLVFAASHALLTMLLADAIADDIPEVRSALVGLGQVLPDAFQDLTPNAGALGLVTVGLVAFVLAGGTYLVSRESGTAFALLAVSTVGWFLFPYSQVPWVPVFQGAGLDERGTPGMVWLFSGLIVALSTAEMVASARDALVAQVRERKLHPSAVALVRDASRRAAGSLLAGSLAVGGLVALLYAVLRDDLSNRLLLDPHLIWVPALLGALGALAVWGASRVR